MVTGAEAFAQDKFTVVKNFISIEQCQSLADNLMQAIDQKRTRPDSQCPLSQSIYSDAVFNQFMIQIQPVVEAAIRLSLLPTYTYARRYQPGEELKAHFDRYSTEIGVTITLACDGDVWPIYMADDDVTNTAEIKLGQRNVEYRPVRTHAINIEVGDALIYRGNEKLHWRDVYTQGQSQSQLILSYVDAHGAHTEWLYDKRPQCFDFLQGTDQ